MKNVKEIINRFKNTKYLHISKEITFQFSNPKFVKNMYNPLQRNWACKYLTEANLIKQTNFKTFLLNGQINSIDY